MRCDNPIENRNKEIESGNNRIEHAKGRALIRRVMHTNKMKQGITFSVIAIALLGVVLSTFAEDNGRIKKEKIILQKFNQQSTNSIGQYRFPLTVNSFVKDLGQPDSTFIDDSSETCPICQVHSWCLRSQNLKILVLGDNYGPKVDYFVNCRLFAVAKCNSSKETKFKGLWGIELGDSDKAVKENCYGLPKIIKISLLHKITNEHLSIFF